MPTEESDAKNIFFVTKKYLNIILAYANTGFFKLMLIHYIFTLLI